MNDYIDNPNTFLQTMEAHKKVLIIKEVVGGETLYEVSLHKKGPREDKLYLKNPQLLTNIRRGNTLIQLGDKVEFCRRGMRKFYDLEDYYLTNELGSTQHKLLGIHKYCQGHILHPVREALSNGSKVHMYRMFKENGEHCQISYTNGQWLIASKNFTILASNPDDLSQYTVEKYQNHSKKQSGHSKFTWAMRIAEEWFKIQIPHIEELKQFLANHTLIAEYCGNDEYQHITRYTSQGLKFYAIVENNSNNSCLPVEQCRAIFNKYQLSFVRNEEIKGIATYEDFLNSLRGWLKKVSEAPMELEGEGSVVYVVADNGTQQTISLCKLKTVEYLIYRELREIIKILAQRTQLNENVQINQLLCRLLTQMTQITKCYQPPKPFSYYLHLSKLSFEEVYSKKIPFQQLRYKFVDFIEHMRNIQESRKDEILQLQNIQVEHKLKHVRMVIITLPQLINDQQFSEAQQKLNIQQIDSQFMPRTQKSLNQRAMSILHLVAKMPYNITNEQQLDQYLLQSEHNLNEPYNICFVFIGLNQQGLDKALGNLKNNAFEKSNPLTSSFSSQFTAARPKDQQAILERWYSKAIEYKNEIVNQYPNRSFCHDNFNVESLDKIFKKFEVSNLLQVNNLSDEEEQEVRTDKQIVVIYPLLIPGAGKTTFLEYIKQEYKDYPFYYLSGDEVTDQLIKDKLGVCDDELQVKFKKVFKNIKERFQQELFKKMTEIINDPSHQVVLFIDRNCVPNTLISNIEHIMAIQNEISMKMAISIKIINLGLLFPEQEPNLGDTPFNVDYILTILNRLIERNDHILLGDDLMYKVLVCFKNVSLYNGFKCKANLFKRLNIHKTVRMDPPQDKLILTKEERTDIHQRMQICVENSLKSKELGHGQEYDDFIQAYFSIKEKQQNQLINIVEDNKMLCERMSRVINKIFSQ